MGGTTDDRERNNLNTSNQGHGEEILSPECINVCFQKLKSNVSIISQKDNACGKDNS